jgi:hypothetical protein
MNVLKKAGIAFYGTGFAYTFGEVFLDTTVRKDRLYNPDMMDYAVYSISGAIFGLFAGVVWPLPIVTKILYEYDTK